MLSSYIPLLRQCADEIAEAVVAHRGRGYSGERETQYHLDLAADEVAVRLLTGAGLRVISEESGVSGSGDVTVVVDPIDGSTNCDQGIPFFATSLAVLHGGELVASVVVNQATHDYYEAELGSGSHKNGQILTPRARTTLGDAIVAFSGLPPRHLGWAQYRALGAASLEICLVAEGALDVFGVANHSTLHPWDYLGGLLALREAGGVWADYRGAELISDVMNPRHPVFAGNQSLLTAMLTIGEI